MRRFILAVLAFGLISSLTLFVSRRPVFAEHATQQRAIPRSWGPLRGVSTQYLYFEDAGGTIRVYDVNKGGLEATISRTK